MKFLNKKLKGFSLVELILAIGVFATISSSIIFLFIDSTQTLDNTRTRSVTTNLIDEINTALLLIKNQSWQNITLNTDDGEKHLEFISGEYQIVDGEGSYKNLTYSFNITNALRDPLGNLVETVGDLDPHTRVINMTISWNDSLGKSYTITPKIYLNDWNTYSLIDTTTDDFNLGSHTNTYVENLSGGEVSLETMLYSDWCNPSLSTNTYSLPGNGVPKSISTFDDIVIMGSGDNASGDPFLKIVATEDPNTNMPVVTDEQTLSTGYKTNDIFLLNNTTALLATDTNSEEVLILELNSSINQIGFFDIPANTDADTVSAYSDVGYVTEANNLRSFDLSSYSGGRSELESVSLGGQANKTHATDIYADDQYIYLTLEEHTNEFVIYEHTPNISLVGQADIGDINARALFISEDKTKAFIGTENSTTLDEFYILDISNKNGNYPILNSHDLGGMSVNALVSIDNRVMIGGQGGQQYQVLDIENMSTPTTCGSLTVGVTINDIALVQTTISNYTYVLSDDGVLRFIRGGLGGGGAGGNGYVENGEYISQIFDTESILSQYFIITLQRTLPSGTNLQLQIRASDNIDMSGSSWTGPDGTSSTYYEGDEIYNIPMGLLGRYFQYKAVFTSDTVNTPLLEEIIINYEK
jgi:type II secretory pathway pseudopilin PulG